MKSEWENRSFTHYQWVNGLNTYPNGSPTVDGTSTQAWSNDLVESHNTPFARKKMQAGIAVGGDFLVRKRTYEEFSTLGDKVDFSTSTNPHRVGYHWRGPQFAYYNNIGNGTFPIVNPSSDAELAAMGRFAISQVAPTKSLFDMASFVGELREGLPHAVGFASTSRGRTSAARSAGGEYLNVQFGWKPLANDAKKFGYAVSHAAKAWEQYVRMAGKPIKRDFQWDVEDSTVISDPIVRQTRPVMGSQALSNATGNGTVTITTRTYRKVWFEGTFRYYLPSSPLALYESRGNKLFGTRLDPNTLWQLAPWSWAFDWIADAGTLMENLSLFSADSLVMPWAHVMEHRYVTKTYEWRGNVYKTYPGPQYLRQVFRTDTKRRISASPYGFLLDWGSFSPTQWAILGALGLSRS